MRLLADFLRSLDPDEVRPAVNLMLGRGPGAKTGVSWAALIAAARAAYGDQPIDASKTDSYVDAGEVVRRMAQQAASARMHTGVDAPDRTILDIQRGFEAVAAARGRKEKERLLVDLLSTSPDEAAWIARNAVGEMRTGAQEGLLLEAIAAAAGRPVVEIRRALVGAGDVAALAQAALTDARDSGARLADLGIRVGTPVPPMLANSAQTLHDAYVALGGRLALEWKLDGARVQIHKHGDRVQLWSRRMTDVTARLPDVAELARHGVPAEQAILEGEVIVLGADNKPIPFQDVMRRWLRQLDAAGAAAEHPASVFLFDCLYAAGDLTLDRPYAERWHTLDQIRGALPTMPRFVVEGPPDAPPTALLAQMQRFYDDAIAAGHEGVMAKALDAPYAPGRRGSHWLKVKAETTLDLAIVGADWGTGRRHKWLSNYHLACRDETTGEFLSVGETFKGLTDAEFEAMTARLLALQTGQRGGYVSVEPRVVVEVKFNGVQRSTRLPSGVALRFARITAIRDDKPTAQVETLTHMRSLLPDAA